MTAYRPKAPVEVYRIMADIDDALRISSIQWGRPQMQKMVRILTFGIVAAFLSACTDTGLTPGEGFIDVDGGQVWYQINSKRFRLREGMQVRIYPSPFGGSFRLSASNMNGFIQVRRIQ